MDGLVPNEAEVSWISPLNGGVESPFVRGSKERPLRLTLHTKSYAGLDPANLAAIQIVQDLCHLPVIEVITDVPGDYPYFEIEAPPSDERDRTIPFIVRKKDGMTSYMGFSVRQWEFPFTGEQLLIRAHEYAGQDVFITASRDLLGARAFWLKGNVNVMSPVAAVKLIGMFLRSRDNFVLSADGIKVRTGQSSFYWDLARHLLPNSNVYGGALVQRSLHGPRNSGYYPSITTHYGPYQFDDLLYLNQSLLQRCSRALMARDAVGFEYYKGPSSESEDQALYHFDYLLLLLSGSLDALALIARRVYGLEAIKERDTGFRNAKYCDALRRAGANAMVAIVLSKEYRNTVKLLSTLRNCIHGASNPTVTVSDKGIFIDVLAKHQESLVRAASEQGSLDRWGFVENGSLRLRPYFFVKTLVGDCFAIINRLMSATDVSRLFESNRMPEILTDQPNKSESYLNRLVQERVPILG